MSIRSAYRYQLADQLVPIIIYWAIILSLLILTSVGVASFSLTVQGKVLNINGTDAVTAVFLFISGLCSFREPYLMLTQNGVSRKSIFSTWILVALTVAALLAAISMVLLLVGKALSPHVFGFQYKSLFELIYARTLPQNSLLMYLVLFLLVCLTNAACLTLGYFISIMFYRLNKAGKIAVGAGVPVGLGIALPIVDYVILNSRINYSLTRILTAAFRNPYSAMFSFALVAAVFGISGWVLIRRADLKV